MTSDRHMSNDEPLPYEPLDSASNLLAPETDPVARWLRSVAAMLVVVLLVTTVSFMLYISSIDTPRTAQERDIERYRTAVADDPDTQLNHVLLAYSYARADRYDDAMKSIDSAYIISDNALVGIAEADVLRLSGQLDEAVTAYDRVLPKVERAYESTLRELRKQNIGSEPPDTQMQQLLLGRGLALRELGSYEDALRDFEAALAIAPTDATLLVAIGETHAAMSNVTSATASFEAALRFIPDMPEALIGLRDLGLTPEVQGRP